MNQNLMYIPSDVSKNGLEFRSSFKIASVSNVDFLLFLLIFGLTSANNCCKSMKQMMILYVNTRNQQNNFDLRLAVGKILPIVSLISFYFVLKS